MVKQKRPGYDVLINYSQITACVVQIVQVSRSNGKDKGNSLSLVVEQHQNSDLEGNICPHHAYVDEYIDDFLNPLELGFQVETPLLAKRSVLLLILHVIVAIHSSKMACLYY